MALTTNLAARPFRNERLPWLLTGLTLVFALLLSVAHARFLGRLLSGGDARTVQSVLQDEARIAELEDALGREPPMNLEPAELNRLQAVKELVDRRVFPWRRLLRELEDLLPEDVRLSALTPSPIKGGTGMQIALSGVARSKDAAFSFAESLQAAPSFSHAVLTSLNDGSGGVEFAIDVAFHPPDPTPRDAGLVPRPAPEAPPVPGSGRSSP